MAVPSVNIVGSVLGPDGIGVEGGTIDALLSVPGSVDDDSTSETYKIADVESFVIAEDGTVNFNLVPNDTISPSGTTYRITYNLPDGSKIIERWTIATSPATIDIGDIALVGGPGFLATFAILFITDEADLPTADAAHRGWTVYLLAGTGESDVVWRCMKDDAEAYDWVILNVG